MRARRALHKCETITSASFHPLNGQTPFVSPGINSDAAATCIRNAAFRSFRVARFRRDRIRRDVSLFEHAGKSIRRAREGKG